LLIIRSLDAELLSLWNDDRDLHQIGGRRSPEMVSADRKATIPGPYPIQHQERMMRHIHQRLSAEEQRQVNRLLNRVLLLYAVLIVATLGLTAVRMPENGFPEARAANTIPAPPGH